MDTHPSGSAARPVPHPGPQIARSRPTGDDVVTQVIRPAAIVPDEAARDILTGMAAHSAYADGLWVAEPSRWTRYDRPWNSPTDPGDAVRIGTVGVTYGMPTKYEITIYQVVVTQAGADRGVSIGSLCDEALAFGGLTLADCPRATLPLPPRPFRH